MTSIDIDAVTRGIATAALWADGTPLPDSWEVQTHRDGADVVLSSHEGESDAVAAATAAGWPTATGINLVPRYDSGDGPELGGLEGLTLRDEDMATLRTYAARFLHYAPSLLVVAFLDEARQNPAAEVQTDPAGYLGHTLYLSASGHGVSFTDRNTMAARFAPLDEVARRECGALEHAGFYAAEDDETAYLDMLDPASPVIG